MRNTGYIGLTKFVNGKTAQRGQFIAYTDTNEHKNAHYSLKTSPRTYANLLNKRKNILSERNEQEKHVKMLAHTPTHTQNTLQGEKIMVRCVYLEIVLVVHQLCKA